LVKNALIFITGMVTGIVLTGLLIGQVFVVRSREEYKTDQLVKKKVHDMEAEAEAALERANAHLAEAERQREQALKNLDK
jgi:hypothetical protein